MAGHGIATAVTHDQTVTQDQVRLPDGHPLTRMAPIAAGVGVLALAATFLLGGADQATYASYLVGVFYALTIALGGLVFVLIQFASRAGWSVAVRRLAEHAAGTLPLFALLFVPLALGVQALYPWTDVEHLDAILQGKTAFLNPTGWIVRGVAYVALWSLLGWYFRRRSLAQDADARPETTRNLQSLSAPALIVFGVTVTFASFDWLMSIDPHWYSTIFGVYIFAGCMVAILAFLPLVTIAGERWGDKPPLAGVVTLEHYHDVGKLLFGFVVFWAYIAFSQFMLIWYGAIPEETAWYAERLHGSWRGATLALAIGHFVLPFFILLMRSVKRNRVQLAAVSVWLLVVHYLDLYWLVMPAVHPEGFAPRLTDLTAWIGATALFFAAFCWLARRPAMVPVGDPRLPESLSFENM